MKVLHLLRSAFERLRVMEAPTVRNARLRQEQHLDRKTVLSRRRQTVNGATGPVAFVATVAPYEQRFTPLSDEQLRSIRDNAKLIVPFMSFHAVKPSSEWSLEDLDMAFSAWTDSGRKEPYSDDFIIEVAGAAFGEHCAKHLNMEWVLVEDQDGKAIGLRSRVVEQQSFPFATVSKRIPVREHGFFKPVFLLIKQQASEGTLRTV